MNLYPQDAMAPTSLAAIYLDDIDRDGWLDVLGAVDCCTPGQCRVIHPVLRSGAREFADHGGLVDEGKGVIIYSLFSADFHAGEKVIGALGLECPSGRGVPFYIQKGADTQGYPHFVLKDPTPVNQTGESVLKYGGPPMGGAIADINGDGLLDLALSLQIEHFVLLGQPAWPFNDVTHDTGYWRIFSDLGIEMIPWSTAFLDIDQDGRPDAIHAHGGDDFALLTTDKLHLVGPEHVSVYWNGGGARFADMTAQTRLDRRGQWMMLATGDLDGAVKAVSALSGPPADAIASWLGDAKALLAAREALTALSGPG